MTGVLRSKWRSAIAVLVLALVWVLAGCSMPPEALDKAADALPAQIKDARANVEKSKSDFQAKLGQSKYSFIKEYAPAQQHVDRFDQASAKLDEADKVYKANVKAVLDDYNDKRQGELDAGIKAVNKLKDEALKLAADPAQWADKVVNVKADPRGTLRQTATSVQSTQEVYGALNKDVDTAKKLYTKNAANIDEKFQPLATQHADALRAHALLQAEAAKSAPNYALMTTYVTTAEERVAAFNKAAPDFQAKLNKLALRETHTLIDLRVDSTVEISRTSWDEASDWDTDSDYDYPAVPVDMDTANYFAQFPADKVIATYGGWGTKFETKKDIDRAQWDKLGIDPKKDWPGGGDDSAEYYVGEIEDTYCNKLRVMTDGKWDASGRPAPADNYCSKYDTEADLAQGMYWVEADELDADAIGMDIYSKTAGDFEDQASESASPPGIAYVGDPATGEWKTDNDGNSFWAFYGQYAFFRDLIGGPSPYHYRYEYDEWNRGYRYGGKPYYSSSGGQPRYGGKSPAAASRFPGSTYVKSGLRNATVRNAGPAARAGGPGNGGK